MSGAQFPHTVPVVHAGDYTLRGWSLDDAGDYYDWMSDPDVWRYLGAAAPTRAAAKSDIARFMAQVERGSAIRWAVEDRRTGRAVGRCHFFRWDRRHAKASLGYALAKTHWGQGVTTLVVRAALDWAFGDDGPALHRVEAAAALSNAASTRVLAKMGFTSEGVLREYRECAQGHEDFGVYGLLRREWAASREKDAVPDGAPVGSVARDEAERPRAAW